MMNKWGWTLAGVLVGGIAGFVYWKVEGCTGGHCAIWSSPYNSTLYAAAMGGLLGNMKKPKPSPADEKDSGN